MQTPPCVTIVFTQDGWAWKVFLFSLAGMGCNYLGTLKWKHRRKPKNLKNIGSASI